MFKSLALTFVTLNVVTVLAMADDTASKPTASTNAAGADVKAVKSSGTGTNSASTNAASKQAEAASTTAKFGKVAVTDETYKTAVDAHALDAALKLANKDGAFKGTVTKVFEPRGATMAIVNFDADYKTALTALLKKENFDKFPALTNLVDKKVLISGKFIEFQGRAEIILTNASQVKIVE